MKTKFVKDRMNEIGTLGKNEVRVIAIRPTKSEKVQVVFLQNIEREGRTNLLGVLNKSDERFNQTGARPFWISAEIKDLAEAMPELAEPAKKAKETDDYVAVNLVNPTMNGRPVCIQITETHTANQRDIDNLELSAKQDGQGNYLMAGGLAIFERPILTYKELAKHTFIEHDSTTKDIADLDFNQGAYQPEEEKASEAQDQQKEIVDEEPAEKETVPAE